MDMSKRELTPGRKAWFRQTGEGAKAYEAFMTYLMIPSEERTQKACAAILGKSESMIQKWSAMWSWAFRVAAYEEHYLLLKLESVQAEQDIMWREQKSVADLGMSIVGSHFEALITAMGETRDNVVVKPDALVRLFDTAAKVQRMAVLGRIAGAADIVEQQEKLAERYADELAQLIGEVMNDIGLDEEQSAKAKDVLERHLVGKK